MPPQRTADHGERFPVELLVPEVGVISASIARPRRSREYRLRWEVVVPLEPLMLWGRQWDTELEVRSIPLSARSWRHLAGATFSDPTWPRLGVEDGDTYPRDAAAGVIGLFDRYHQVWLTDLRLGSEAGTTLHAHLAGVIDFEPSADIDYAPAPFALDTTLEVGGVAVEGDADLVAAPSLDEAVALAAPLLRLADYLPPNDGEIVTFLPRAGPPAPGDRTQRPLP